jgi:hypothetical protein
MNTIRVDGTVIIELFRNYFVPAGTGLDDPG